MPREQNVALRYPRLPDPTVREQGGLVGDVASLFLSFLICKRTIVIPAMSRGGYEREVVHAGVQDRAWHTARAV